MSTTLHLLQLTILLGFTSYGQANDSLQPPIKENMKRIIQDDEQEINLKWVDSLIPQIAKN